MDNTQEQIHFTIKIVLGSDGKANFTYFIGDNKVTGGGIVRTKTAGIYSLDKETLAQGFLFIGATITDVDTETHCAQDFSFKVIDNGHKIIITDTDENSGTACLIFNVECNGKTYESADPQVENKEED